MSRTKLAFVTAVVLLVIFGATAETKKKRRIPAPPSTEEPAPLPVQKKISTEQYPGCKRNRDQGSYGTCGSFCLTCLVDQVQTRSSGKGFRASANWLTLLTAARSICDDTGSSNLNDGAYPSQTYDLVKKMGVCSEQSYLPYSENEPGGNSSASYGKMSAEVRKKLKHFRDRIQSRQPSPLVYLNPSAEKLKGLKLSQKQLADSKTQFNMFKKQYGKGLDQVQMGYVNPWWVWINQNQLDEKQFGLTTFQIYQLFCPVHGKSIDSLSAGDLEVQVDNFCRSATTEGAKRFCTCAKEARGTGRDYEYCPMTKKIVSGSEAVEHLISTLRQNQVPQPVDIWVEQNGKKTPHCITVTGYDPATKTFDAVNSWGNLEDFRRITFDEMAQKFNKHYETSCPKLLPVDNSPATDGEGGDGGDDDTWSPSHR
jgi:hypothetical protein